MSETLTRILAQIDSLSQQERAELAHVALRSLEPEEAGAAQAWDEELERRIARLQSGQSVEVPAEQVFAKGLSKNDFQVSQSGGLTPPETSPHSGG